MRVRQLINKLKKLDQDAVVLIQTHDQTEDETDGEVNTVESSDSEVLQERCNGAVVVIR
ncbi:hypothetical protein AH02_33 [Pseudomonas phage AH02]|nr:hypothetical protein AH02_33 [Pseudomonas phage AH02]